MTNHNMDEIDKPNNTHSWMKFGNMNDDWQYGWNDNLTKLYGWNLAMYLNYQTLTTHSKHGLVEWLMKIMMWMNW